MVGGAATESSGPRQIDGTVGPHVSVGEFCHRRKLPNDLDVLLVMDTEFAIEALLLQTQVAFDHVQARLRFQADVFWTKASIDPQVLQLWLDTYQTGKDFTRRGIVEVVVT